MVDLSGKLERAVMLLRTERFRDVIERYGRRLQRASCVLRPRRIAISRLLRSGENGMPAAQYARHTGNLLRPSMRFVESPHVRFLQRYLEIGDRILEPDEFQQTDYYRNAQECIATTGQYFNCSTDEQLLECGRAFVDRFEGRPFRRSAPAASGNGFSAPWRLPLVRRIRYSDCYEVTDGNHRLAMAYVRGQKTCWTWVLTPGTLTPLQELVLDVTWTRGNRILYQPIDSPEFGSAWTCVRQCTDRWAMIAEFLKQHHLTTPCPGTSLDIACSYGWFVRAFRDLGFDAHGVEIDWASVQIGRWAYGLEPERVSQGEVVQALRRLRTPFDVTSCFSLLHHVVMGRMSISAESLIREIDRLTGRVLFLDTGEDHELWFRKSLRGWNPEYIETWIRANSGFKQIYRLGVDRDGRSGYRHNYGRTLFACMR